MSEKKRDSERTVGAYIGAIIASGIVMFILNKLPDWNFRYVTDEYPAALWAMNLSLLALVILLTVFPFDFSHFIGEWGITVARIVLIAVIVGTSIGAITHVFKAIGSLIFVRQRSQDEE